MNKINFDSKITETINIDSIIRYNYDFNSVILSNLYFNSVIDTFTPSDTQRARFYSNSTMKVNSFNSSVTALPSQFPVTFVSDGDHIDIDSDLIQMYKSYHANFVHENKITATIHIDKNMGNVAFTGVSKIAIAMNNSKNIGSVTVRSNSGMSASAITNQYYMLSHWDGYSVSALDLMNLSQMDYVTL
jgi:hypothetical protein